MSKSHANFLVNKAGILRLTNGVTVVFYGLKVENDQFVYYTARGIRDLLILKKKQAQLHRMEDQLIAQNYLAKTPCEEIEEIVCLNKKIGKA